MAIGVPKHKRHPISCSVANILQAEREKQGLSLSAVAEKAGLSYQSIALVERQERVPNLDTLIRVCGALNLKLSVVIQQAEQRSDK